MSTDDLEPVDYMANKFADGVFPGGAKYIFSSEDWLAFKDEVRRYIAAEKQRSFERGKREAYEDIQNNASGGGSWRRIITLRLAALTKTAGEGEQ